MDVTGCLMVFIRCFVFFAECFLGLNRYLWALRECLIRSAWSVLVEDLTVSVEVLFVLVG